MYTFSIAFVLRTIERSEWADVQWPAGQLACFVHREKRHMHEQYPNYVALIPNVIAVYFNYSIRLIMPAIATKAMHILNTKQFLPEQMIGQYFEPVVRSFDVNWLNAFSSQPHSRAQHVHTVVVFHSCVAFIHASFVSKFSRAKFIPVI